MKLHVGCGNKFIKGFKHLDLINYSHIDYICNFTDMKGVIDDNSIDEIYCCHALEHIPRKYNQENKYRHIEDCIQEFFRVLKPGAKLRIAVPNFEAILNHYQKNKDIKILYGLIYGGCKNEFDLHYTPFNFKILEEILKGKNFSNIKIYDTDNFLPNDFDDYSKAYLPHMDKSGMLMSLNIECTKK